MTAWALGSVADPHAPFCGAPGFDMPLPDDAETP